MSNVDEVMGEFQKFIYENFADMPKYRVADVSLRVMGRLINRFDNKGQESVTKEELIELFREAVEFESDVYARFLERAERRREREHLEQEKQDGSTADND